MEHFIDEICDYIEYLRNSQNLQVTLHPSRHNLAITTNAKLMKYNLHYNPYCLYLKTDADMWLTCIRRQKKINAAIEAGAFCGTCHAGVFEFVYPIYDHKTNNGFISVSGYHGGKEGISKSLHTTAPYAFNREILNQLYDDTLYREIPSREFVDALLYPLVRMLELLAVKSNIPKRNDACLPYYDILQYINRHYTTKLTLEQIAHTLHFSPSYISHTFKQNCGMSISEYINHLRVETAKDMLMHTRAAIEEIAIACGFGEASYFSYVFRQLTNQSPRQYRKNKGVEIEEELMI